VRIWDARLTVAKVSDLKFREKTGNSFEISNGFSHSGICEFESSQVSQAFRISENFLLWMKKARQMRAFLIANSL
jgi:hypothetical protein